jgi:hypothetical protein
MNDFFLRLYHDDTYALYGCLLLVNRLSITNC